MDWYKIYHGLPADPRLSVVARRAALTRAEALALWIALHDHASRQKPRGSLYGLDAEATALMLEIDAAKAEAALDAFYEKGMIDIENSIRDWARLQYRSTDRVRAHRARKYAQNHSHAPVKTNPDSKSDYETDRTAQTHDPPPAPRPAADPDTETEIAARRARLQQQALRRPCARMPHDD